jgi:hypothetical protein
LKYEVRFVRNEEITVTVEANDEYKAVALANEVLADAERCAHCAGWGKKFSVDSNDWQPVDEFYGMEYHEIAHGKFIQVVK